MNEWMSQRADELATAGAVDRDALELTPGAIEALLDLAAYAAHEGGARTNAPLLCYLVGRAQAAGASLDELAQAVRASTS